VGEDSSFFSVLRGGEAGGSGGVGVSAMASPHRTRESAPPAIAMPTLKRCGVARALPLRIVPGAGRRHEPKVGRVILLSLYALALWWLVVTFRRTWKGVAIAVGGCALVLPLVDPLVYLIWWMMGEKPTWVFPFLYAYSGVLFLVCVFLGSLPRTRADRPCPGCGYDLTGVTGGACPECGREIDRPKRVSPRALHRSATENT
jgi:hypothetical protein